MDQLLALVGFSFICSVTPGPNNVLLWASGTAFGLRRTIRHILGSALGLGLMALAASGGLALLVTNVPQLALGMKVAGSAYLLYLAWQIAHLHGLERGRLGRPMGVGRAAAFQLVNPKAWVFALGAVTTFRPTTLPIVPGSALVALTMMLVILPSAALWAAGGDALGRVLTGERASRAVGWILALAVVLTVASVWI